VLRAHCSPREARHSLLVSGSARECPKEHGGREARDEETANVAHIIAVVLVQAIDVRTLEPVPSCKGEVRSHTHSEQMWLTANFKGRGSANFVASGWIVEAN
jgi:hypothetical protein